MKIEAIFRRRAEDGERVAELNSALIEKLSKISGFFSENYESGIGMFDPGDGDSASTNLSPYLTPGMSGGVIFASRRPGMVEDKARSDDSLGLKIDLEKIDFMQFSSLLFPEIVRALDCYRSAVITDVDLHLDDHEEIVEVCRSTALDVDGRDGVFRFNPVNYFDDELCARAFSLRPAEVVARLEGHCKTVEQLHGGVFFLVIDRPIVGPESLELHRRVRELLHA